MKYHVSSETRWAWLFLAPCLVGLLIFTYLPTLGSFTLSFTYWNLLGIPEWVGLANYGDILQDPRFWHTLQNTTVFVSASTGLEVTMGLCMALLLNRPLRGQGLFRAIYFLPFITPMISVSVVWAWLYEPQYGVLNAVLDKLGLLQLLEIVLQTRSVAWLYEPRTAMAAIVLLNVWKNVGFHLVIFLAGLQGIPQHVYESATLDGAGSWQRFWRITLPMLTPTLFFVGMISLINGFQVFDSIYLMTQGGPEQSTTVLVYWLFQHAFLFYKVGPASALAYVLFVIVLVLTLLQWGLRKRWVLYEAG